MPKRPSEGEAPVSPRAAAVVFALLVLATVAAFAYAQRLKRDPLVLDRVSFVGAPRNRGVPRLRRGIPSRHGGFGGLFEAPQCAKPPPMS